MILAAMSARLSKAGVRPSEIAIDVAGAMHQFNIVAAHLSASFSRFRDRQRIEHVASNVLGKKSSKSLRAALIHEIFLAFGMRTAR